jgi:hypothetical protein
MTLSDDDLKEIFGLFTSCTLYERDQIYSPGIHYYKAVNLSEEYELTEEKRGVCPRCVACGDFIPSQPGLSIEKRC